MVVSSPPSPTELENTLNVGAELKHLLYRPGMYVPGSLSHLP